MPFGRCDLNDCPMCTYIAEYNGKKLEDLPIINPNNMGFFMPKKKS